MKKPTRQEIEKTSDQELAEWSAVYLKKLENSYICPSYWVNKKGNPVISKKDWNPAQNIGQAWEILLIMRKQPINVWSKFIEYLCFITTEIYCECDQVFL